MNRVLWIIIGALLLAAGVLGLLAGNGTLPSVDKSRTLLTTEMINTWNANETMATALTIVGGLLLALLGGLLLQAQLRRRGGARMRDLPVQPPTETAQAPPQAAQAGSTEVTSRALHRALRHDLEQDRQVRHAAVRLTGPTEHPQLLVRLAVTPDADIARLAGHLDQAVNRFATTSGVRPNLSDVVLRMPQRGTSRVG